MLEVGEASMDLSSSFQYLPKTFIFARDFAGSASV